MKCSLPNAALFSPNNANAKIMVRHIWALRSFYFYIFVFFVCVYSNIFSLYSMMYIRQSGLRSKHQSDNIILLLWLRSLHSAHHAEWAVIFKETLFLLLILFLNKSLYYIYEFAFKEIAISDCQHFTFCISVSLIRVVRNMKKTLYWLYFPTLES